MAEYIFEIDGDYVNFNGGANLWRLHRDSNCVAWHWDETGDLFFDVYDKQYSVKAENIGQVSVGGVTLTTAADFATEIVNVFTGLSSGGGSGYLVKAEVTLTDAQIKALPTAPHPIIVASPGENKVLLFMGGFLVLNTTAGAYTNVDTESNAIYIGYGADAISYCSTHSIMPTGAGGSNIFGGVFNQGAVVDIRPDWEDMTRSLEWMTGLDNMKNQPLTIIGYNNTGDLTGGNPANTMKIIIYYIVVDL